MKQIIPLHNERYQWTHQLTRPFTLLGTSLWQYWYDCQRFEELFGMRMKNVLFFEEHPNVAKKYFPQKEFEQMKEAVKELVINNPQKCKVLLNEGKQARDEAEKTLKKKKKMYPSLSEALEIFAKMTIQGVTLAFTTLETLEKYNIKNEELRCIAEELRKKSVYPAFIEEILTPLAEEKLKIINKSYKREHAELITIKELLNKDTTKLNERIHARKEGKRFIYLCAEEKETVYWVEDVMQYLQQLDPQVMQKKNELKGQCAYPGKVKGIARVVLTDYYDPKIVFNTGDILVSITSCPALMPLIEKCSAIVTDEGGVTCHAAIVSRELKKPCVMGTKYATHIFKDGDIVEVDAEKGIVKKIKTLQEYFF